MKRSGRRRVQRASRCCVSWGVLVVSREVWRVSYHDGVSMRNHPFLSEVGATDFAHEAARVFGEAVVRRVA